MKFLCILTFVAIAPFYVIGQQTDNIPIGSEDLCDKIYTIVETMPVYPTGEAEVSKFISQIVANNPCKITSIFFVVDKKGQVVVTDITAKKSQCIDKVINRIQRMPLWTPGFHRGEPVCVQFRIQVKHK